MLKREQKLRQSPSCQRAISLPLSSRHEINRQVRLRVVREFNLPDTVADLLEVSTFLLLFRRIILESPVQTILGYFEKYKSLHILRKRNNLYKHCRINILPGIQNGKCLFFKL